MPTDDWSYDPSKRRPLHRPLPPPTYLSGLSTDWPDQCGRTYPHAKHPTTEGTCYGLDGPRHRADPTLVARVRAAIRPTRRAHA